MSGGKDLICSAVTGFAVQGKDTPDYQQQNCYPPHVVCTENRRPLRRWLKKDARGMNIILHDEPPNTLVEATLRRRLRLNTDIHTGAWKAVVF
jgi:hypothetical protein